MGEYADMAIDDMLAYEEWMWQHPEDVEPGEFNPFWTPRSRNQRRQDRQRVRRSVRECQFCGKFPLFFHEERPHKWILAEWNDENRPVKHICKLKGKFNEFQRVSK